MIIALSQITVLALALAAAPSAPLEVSTRGDPRAPGKHAAASKSVPWSALPLQERTLFDVQTGAMVTVKGVALETLLARGPAHHDEDTALLHFANGMMVPVPLDARGALIDVFVAHQRRREDGVFVAAFPPIVRERATWIEQRAIVFGDNKVVVSQADHPALAPTTTRFSPWSHVDSLKRVELVRAGQVHAALDVSANKDVRKGLEVFEQRCQFCHGVDGKGASFGWDFVAPIPLSTWRDADSLLYHVKMTKLDGPERGLMMPPQPDVTIEEMRALWAWMNAVSKGAVGNGGVSP